MLRRRDNGEREQNFWISYADLMAGLLFVFILLVGAIVVKTVLMRSDLFAIRADLQAQKTALGLSEKALAEKKKRLREIQALLAASREENAHLSMELALLQSEAEGLRISVDDMNTTLHERTTALALTREEMEQLKALLLETETQRATLQSEAERLTSELETAEKQHAEDTNLIKLRDDEMAELEKALLLKSRAYQKVVEDLNLTRIKIKNLTGIKVKVVQHLKEELGDSISIDPKSGALRFASNVLFNQGEATLKPEAKQELSRVLGHYIDALLSDKQMRRYIDRIIIEGHTNSDGSYLFNLELSQQRALAVMTFLYTQYPKNRKLFRQYLSASGRSFTEPVLGADGKEDKQASRRIEIKFRIKNEEAVRELMNYLNAKGEGGA
ncbi:OmpA family protein [Sulfurimonas diazotrophicus]|uniref:OmpA family protein n=1 Tax=Sulfurimonas diazotrophicus TaxID=3131939 RepID=A0ABZ3HAJ2_9BACT